jgi:hypothetical protein
VWRERGKPKHRKLTKVAGFWTGNWTQDLPNTTKYFWGGVRLSPLGTSATVWLIVPAPDNDVCGAVGGMRIGRGNRSTRSKPAPVPPQIPHDLTWDRTRAAAVGSRQLNAWAMSRPRRMSNNHLITLVSFLLRSIHTYQWRVRSVPRASVLKNIVAMYYNGRVQTCQVPWRTFPWF